jgi:formate/nitrite transporter FocA (FNT family)
VELVFGIRYDAWVSTGELLANVGLAVAGNLVGGLLLVTFARTAQALGASGNRYGE